MQESLNIKIGLVYKAEGSTYEANYEKLIRGPGVAIVPFIAGEQWRTTLEKLASCNGLVIPGGADLLPERYCSGEKLAAANTLTESPNYPALDEIEWRLAKECMELEIPIFAICRGFQLVNQLLGGELYHDLPREFGEKICHRSDEFEDISVPRRKPAFHNITIAPGSRLHEITGATGTEINSFHHQGIMTLAKGLRPTAWTDDGLVEAFEEERGGYILGVQFHPEKHSLFGAAFMRKFCDRITSYRN